MKFETLGLSPTILKSIAELGFNEPTPIQAQAIPLLLEGRDLMGLAQTGTGKTAAFGLPLIQKLSAYGARPGPRATHALILAPTRELVNQIATNLRSFVRHSHLKVTAVVGGQSINAQTNALQRGTDILVATPGRLLDLVERKAIRLDTAKVLVLDEADQMLDLGFIHALRRIAKLVGTPRQTMLFSATMPKLIADLSRDYLTDPVRVEVSPPGRTADLIAQSVHYVDQRAKTGLLINLLKQRPGDLSLVFARTKHGAEKLMKNLVKEGLAAASIHGNKSQGQRERAIKAFRDGEIRVLVATDVAARGIDLPNLDLVIHADLPTNPETLLHRSGRTGRAGRKGVCALIVPYFRRNAARRLMQLARLDATMEPAPGPAEITARTQAQILADESLFAAPREDETDFIGKLLANYGAEQIAAAFLRQQMAARPAPEELSESSEGSQALSRSEHRSEQGARGERGVRGERAERPERSDRFQDGTWFRISLGRKHRAEPRWLLPMICKAGHVTKAAVGSIKVGDTTTDFEISTAMAESFEAAIAANGSGEKGVTIVRADGAGRPAESGGRSAPSGPRPHPHSRPHSHPEPKPVRKLRENSEGKPKGKPGKKKSYKPKPGRDPR